MRASFLVDTSFDDPSRVVEIVDAERLAPDSYS